MPAIVQTTLAVCIKERCPVTQRLPAIMSGVISAAIPKKSAGDSLFLWGKRTILAGK